jgi:hypothetical protein
VEHGVLACAEMPSGGSRRIAKIAAALATLAPVLFGACFNFDATMAGGPLADSGAPVVTGADASVGDGSSPTATSDSGGGGPTDGGSPDASLGADGSGPVSPFCASQVPPDGGLFFCDDFDEHGLPGLWQSYGELGGTLVETDASALSPPNSVDLTTTQLTAGQPINIDLRTPEGVPALPSTLIFSFAVEPLKIDSTFNAGIILGAVDFLDSSGNRYTDGLAINVVSGEPALVLGEQSGAANGGPLPDGAPPVYVSHPLPETDPLAMSAWSTITIELDWTTTTLEGKVSVNGKQEIDVPLTLSLVPTSLQIGIGTSFVTEYEGGLSAVWELRYDNVLFTAH